MLKFPEAMLICGSWLLIAGHGSFGVSLIIVSIICSFFRWSLELHLKRQEVERKNMLLTMATDTVTEFLRTRGISYAAKNDDGTLH